MYKLNPTKKLTVAELNLLLKELFKVKHFSREFYENLEDDLQQYFDTKSVDNEERYWFNPKKQLTITELNKAIVALFSTWHFTEQYYKELPKTLQKHFSKKEENND